MKKIDFSSLGYNAAANLKNDWMLITAGKPEDYNTMTASWGGFGCLWSKDVAFAFIRNTRHTFGYANECDVITLTFFKEEYKSALSILGRKSGRDCDKVALSGLTPVAIEGGVTFEEADITMVCKKLYMDDIRKDAFLVEGLCEQVYPTEDYHRVYVLEILDIYKK